MSGPENRPVSGTDGWNQADDNLMQAGNAESFYLFRDDVLPDRLAKELF